jgi:tRNA A-37 threonylcarbamoyl transferase component Bud32
MWALYFASTILMAVAYFGYVGNTKLWYISQSTYAGVSAPAGPGYIGTFQLLVSHLLNKINLSQVAGFLILAWFITVVPISLIGLAVLIRERFSEKEEASIQKMRINKLYREQNITDELSHFLDAYFNGEKLNQILTHAEQDNKFKLIRSFRGGSNAHTVLVWQEDNMVIKKIALPEYASKLEAQANWLKNRAGIEHIPQLIGEEKTESYYYFDLAYHEEYYQFYDYVHSHSPAESFKILNNVINFMQKSIYKEVPSKNGKHKVTQYIDEKVIGKIKDTTAISNVINQLVSYDQLIINGKKYSNLLQVIDKIQANKKAMKDLSTYNESLIHGDLTVDNLIVNDNSNFLVLDPNDENQVSSKIVDFAKLYQSLDTGYEFLIQLEQSTVKDNTVNFEDSKSQKYAELFKLFDTKLRKELAEKDFRSISFHEGVHYCRMLTYRANINPKTISVFYGTAVKLFNEFLWQYEKAPKK